MEINQDVEDTVQFEISQSICKRSSSDENNEKKKTEQQVLENQQRNEADEQSLCRSISRQEERQFSQASSIRMTSEQKWQEISNLKRQRLLPTLREKMTKEIQELKEQNKQLSLEIARLEQTFSNLRTQLTERQDTIAAFSKLNKHLENLLSHDIQDIKNSNKKIIDQLLSDLQKAFAIHSDNTEENNVQMLRGYIKKDEYHRLQVQKIGLEQELKKIKEDHQKNECFQVNQNDEYLKEISKLKEQLNLQLKEKEQIQTKILEKQTEYSDLYKYVQSNDIAIASQDLQIEQDKVQIESLKILNTKFYQKCINILSQTKNHISLPFSQEIEAFKVQLQNLNEENKYLKEQFVKLKDVELETERKQMLKDIQLSFSRQKISLCQMVIKEKEDQTAQTIIALESILKMKDDELERQNSNIKHLENIIQDTTNFYTTLLSSKQAEWRLLNDMNDDKTKALEIIIKIRDQALQELTKKLNKIDFDHAQQKKKQRQAHKQQLSKSENLVMQLQLELDQIKQSARLNFEQIEKFSQQNGLMINLVKLIEKNQDDLKNMLVDIESINKNHVFDGIVSALFSIREKLQNSELQILSHKSALKNMQEQLQQNIILQQTEERIRQANFQEKENQILSLTNQLKQKTKIIEQFQEKNKISIANDVLKKQFESKIAAFFCQINEKDKVIQDLLREKSQFKDKVESQQVQIQGYRSESTIYQYKIEDLENQIKQNLRKNDPLNSPSTKFAPSQDKQLQNLKKKYDSLSEQLDEANKLITLKQQQLETQKSTNEILEEKIASLEQRLKKSNKAVVAQEKDKSKSSVSSAYCCFFTARSMIENSKGGKEFVVNSVEKYCQRQVKAIEMVFRKDESNNNNFHSSFRPVKISESICLFLLKKADIFFGVATFPETFKGTPSAFLFSVTNEKCIYKSQDGYSQAFTYELNSIIFGKNEIKIKSGYKNVTIQEIIYKGYFENYVKSEVFGPEFKEVSEFDSFEIHKVHV